MVSQSLPRLSTGSDEGRAGRDGQHVDLMLDLVGSMASRAIRPRPRGTGYLPYRYDLHGLLTIGSMIPLHELACFHAPWLGKDYDLEIRVGSVGRGWRSRKQLVCTNDPRVIVYQEQLGRLGANFVLDLGEPMRLTASPLLARSAHVLYTNVVEALLRFLFVARNRMLLHSACVDLDGTGVMLSARTDTGKTGTVLRLLREHPARFLSDDMTILEANGKASSFPKPMTISQHTLRAVDPGDLRRLEWQVLKLKSRLHSKRGRGLGMLLGERNVPIMSMNSVTQLVVPPPKYCADRLVACDSEPSTLVEHLFIIERGEPKSQRLTDLEVVPQLIENTDDAYGFPPFQYFAPMLVLGEEDYPALRVREEQILRSAVRSMALWRLSSDSFGWADEIPRLIRDDQAGDEVTAALPMQRVNGVEATVEARG
jgi:hypothetical protein